MLSRKLHGQYRVLEFTTRPIHELIYALSVTVPVGVPEVPEVADLTAHATAIEAPAIAGLADAVNPVSDANVEVGCTVTLELGEAVVAKLPPHQSSETFNTH